KESSPALRLRLGGRGLFPPAIRSGAGDDEPLFPAAGSEFQRIGAARSADSSAVIISHVRRHSAASAEDLLDWCGIWLRSLSRLSQVPSIGSLPSLRRRYLAHQLTLDCELWSGLVLRTE